MLPENLETARLTAHGNVRCPGGAPVQAARFAWRDPETGERLVARLHGSAAFFAALEACGFERLEEATAGSEWSAGGGEPTPREERPLAASAPGHEFSRLAIVTPRFRGSA